MSENLAATCSPWRLALMGSSMRVFHRTGGQSASEFEGGGEGEGVHLGRMKPRGP
jgi:hypothetical protein